MNDLLSDGEKSQLDDALYSVFRAFARPFSLYIEAQTAVINTSPTFAGMFGDQSQNLTTTPVTPQVYTVSGCILYGNKQPWEYVEPGRRGDYQQNKIAQSMGIVRIKTDATGYALMSQCEQVTLDGFQFRLNSTARPHGLIGPPTRYTFTLEKAD